MTNWIEQLESFTGYQQFNSGQKEALDHLEQMENTIAILPTGGGKSLIYQLFQQSKQGKGLTLIVSPLIALMQDQVMQLQRLGVKTGVALNSQLHAREKKWVLERLTHYDYLFLSPEMLGHPEVKKRLQQIPLNLFVVDEAHCISQWGFDFRPEYTELGRIRSELNHPLTLAISATADEQILSDIKAHLFSTNENTTLVQVPTNRENIYYHLQKVKREEKVSALIQTVETLPKPGIIYVHQKDELETLRNRLKQETDLTLESYHADRLDYDRHLIQHQFLNGELDVILATSAFGMGINQTNVRFVIHYHLPQSIEELIQEDGRSGRDGKQALAMWLVDDDEMYRLYHLKNRLNDRYEEISTLLHYIYRKQNEGESVDLTRVSEENRPFIQFYLNHYHEEHSALAHLRDYIQRQMDNIQRMIQLVDTKTCLRTQLYGNSMTQEKEKCCSNCHPLSGEEEWFNAYLALNRESRMMWDDKWQTRLEKLLG